MPKTDIHPTYYPTATITCSCGAVHTIGSTRESLKVDICKECHPFYSGTQKLIDTAGRVDRFREKMAAAQTRKDAQKPKKPRDVVAEAAPVVEDAKEAVKEDVVADEVVTEVVEPETEQTEPATDGETE